tara:strand:+ start:14628 stop:16496 length:1869 start_codon:yes stop_codon:yes gene_type:complete
MSADTILKEWSNDANVQDDYDFDGYSGVVQMAQGQMDFDSASVRGGIFFLDYNGDIMRVRGDDLSREFELAWPHNNTSHFGTGFHAGIIFDQAGRFLYAGDRYLGRYDPDVDNGSMTISVTNGSDVITKTSGDDFESADAEKYLVITTGGVRYFHRIDTYTSTTEVDIYGSISLPTGSYTAQVRRGWDDQWKDFGTDVSSNSSEGDDVYIATETYEDTVLFGRHNNITTLNTVTDTVTTDASPAFNLPDDFDIRFIHRGANGILIGANFQGKGVLVLWDNYSDRSIAPWIMLDDRLISMCKYGGGWIIITAREIFYTNGYSLESLATSILDMHIDPLTPRSSYSPQTSLVSEGVLHFIAGYSANGKRREGLYRFHIADRLCEFIPREDMNVYDETLFSVFYSNTADGTRVSVGTSTGVSYVKQDESPTVSHLITNPVGKGANTKHAEAVKLDLGIDPVYYATNNTFSFEATVKICPLDQQVQAPAVVKTTQTSSTQIVVDETAYSHAQVGDEIEFLKGNNAGYTRNITAISGEGTATATYTLDRALPSLSASGDNIVRTRFQLVATKSFSSVSEIDPKLLWFSIKNKVKGKRYLLKVEIEDATIPIEIRPPLFVYDDQGVIM